MNEKNYKAAVTFVAKRIYAIKKHFDLKGPAANEPIFGDIARALAAYEGSLVKPREAEVEVKQHVEPQPPEEQGVEESRSKAKAAKARPAKKD
jgi:hypothetical protein